VPGCVGLALPYPRCPKLKEKEQPVVYIKVKGMVASRLEGLSLEVA